MKTKIIVVDDHPIVVTGLRYLLSNCADMEITGSYTNGKELLRALTVTVPDILLLDIHLPEQQGDELATIIKTKYPTLKILALTNSDSLYHVKNMLKKGADGYVLKTTSEDILIDAIRAVCAGKLYIEPSLKEKIVMESLEIKSDFAQQPVLSRTEKEILECIAADMTSQQIADKIFLSKRTIDNYRLSLLSKLGAKNSAGLVKKAIQMGLIS